MGVPPGVDVGDTDPQELTAQESVHLTPIPLVSLLRIAVNGAVVLSSTTAVLVESDRMIGGGGGDVTAELPPHARLAAARIAAANAPTTRTQVFGDISLHDTYVEFCGDALREGSSTPQEWPLTANMILPDLVHVKPVITFVIGAPGRRGSRIGSRSIPRSLSVWEETGLFQQPTPDSVT